ncbi:hypothetical protein BR93DRAFT_221710 [Coniochaeta sp. PMI_546]|nr:hypothetical protein BR93DRAFT_221710 [Coniochaeta sp. PMI_546]
MAHRHRQGAWRLRRLAILVLPRTPADCSQSLHIRRFGTEIRSHIHTWRVRYDPFPIGGLVSAMFPGCGLLLNMTVVCARVVGEAIVKLSKCRIGTAMRIIDFRYRKLASAAGHSQPQATETGPTYLLTAETAV